MHRHWYCWRGNLASGYLSLDHRRRYLSKTVVDRWGAFIKKRYRRIKCTLDREDSPGSGIDECVTGEPEFRTMSSWMCQRGGRDHHNPAQLSTNDLRLPIVKTTAYFAGKRRMCTGDWPAGVGCGGFGFAAQQQRSGDGGGSRRRRTRCLAHPRASENGGGGCLICLRMVVGRRSDMGRPGPGF